MLKEEPWKEHSYLRRLSAEFYRAHAVVHWSMSIADRKRGWLNDVFQHQFRELLCHTAFRYHLICPCYVLMPDHMHLIWMGYEGSSDQRVAMRSLRKQLNRALRPKGFELQKQGYDHVLREESRKQSVFETVAGYVRDNSLRAGLVSSFEDLPNYPYIGCLVPGYPELNIWSSGFWESFWKLYWKLRGAP